MVIVETDAVIQPRTMMIHLENASLADAAVMSSLRTGMARIYLVSPSHHKEYKFLRNKSNFISSKII